MWEFWRDGLAMCGILVKELFLGTQIDTNAYYKGGADEQPAVRVPKLNVTLVWFVGRDGYVRIDGPTWAKPAALKLLRKGLVPFKPGNMNHGREAGKQAKPERVAAGLLKSDLSQRAQWENERRDSVLLLPPCLIFDAAGRKGIHDILQDKVGIKGANLLKEAVRSRRSNGRGGRGGRREREISKTKSMEGQVRHTSETLLKQKKKTYATFTMTLGFALVQLYVWGVMS